jgi:hypothetical protein
LISSVSIQRKDHDLPLRGALVDRSRLAEALGPLAVLQQCYRQELRSPMRPVKTKRFAEPTLVA